MHMTTHLVLNFYTYFAGFIQLPVYVFLLYLYNLPCPNSLMDVYFETLL